MEGQMPIYFVDATPNEEYPIRILQAYRQQDGHEWANSDGTISEAHKIANAVTRQRSEILDRAIAMLQKEEPGQ